MNSIFARQRPFVVLAILLVLAALLLVFYYDLSQVFESGGWNSIVAKFSLYYLFMVVLRSGALLAFSTLDFLYERDLGPPTTYPMVSIIMPCFNEAKVIKEAIESVLTLDYPNYEVLIVDDGSFDSTLAEASKFQEKFRLRIIFQENAGKAAALNRGISEAVGEYFICMDADSAIDKEVIKLAMPYFEKDPHLAAVAGSVVVGNSFNILTRFQKLEYTVGLNLYKKAQSYMNLVTIVPGPIGVFRKAMVTEIGGYHSDTYAEDSDLSIRLLMTGYHIKYCEFMTAVTEAPDEFKALMTQRYRWSRGMVQSILKNLRWLSPARFNSRNLVILSYMVTDTLIIPTANFVFAGFTLFQVFQYGTLQMIGPFFIGLTILDMSISIYAIALEKQNVSLFFLSMVNRLTYGLSLEVMRFFSVIDEFFRIPMKWGTLERKGISRA